MIHIDLFTGLGGFAYAADQVWDNVEHIFCEIDPFCQQVIKKHWKGSVIYGDIRQLTADSYRTGSRTSESQTNKNREEVGKERKQPQFEFSGQVDLLTGGFPCQPFSQAGKRKGTEDNRYLWPEMLRVIQDFKPTWVIAENVRGILTIESGMVFEQVCLDLEGEGYEVQPFIIPAVAKDAPHRRYRVWFVANRKGWQSGKQAEQKRREDISGRNSDAPNTRCERQEVKEQQATRSEQHSWERNWLEVATELCGVDDGLPAELDGFKLSKARHRVERLKALGNAIVPQVAIEIMMVIKKAQGIK